MDRVKCESIKKNRLIISVLGLTLFLASLLLTFSGAYFTDKAGNEITVTSGGYNLELLGEADTTLPGTMKPGDSQAFTIKYKNTGNITGDLNVAISAKTLGSNEFTNEVSIYHNEELVVNSPNDEGIITVEDVGAEEITSIGIRIELSETGSDKLRLPQELEVNINANLKSNPGVWTSNIINTKTSVMYGGYSNSLFTYEKNATGYTVTGFDTVYIDNYLNGVQPTEITIPDKHKEQNVNAISNSAFQGKSLIGVVIPNTIKTIGDSSFAQNQLKTFTIPNNVTQIGNSAFEGNLLTSVKLSNKLIRINTSTFRDNKLTTINIPTSVVQVDSHAFIENPLANAVIAANSQLKVIGDYAFEGTGLTSINLPNTLTTIGIKTFAGNKLKTINLGPLMESIGQEAFANNSITSLVVPATLKNISQQAFTNNKIATLTLKEGLLTIGSQAFLGNLLDEVVIPDTTTTINNGAFSLNKIKLLTIPDSVTKINEDAFGSQTGTYVNFRVVKANLKPGDDVSSPPKLRGYQFNNEWKMEAKDGSFPISDNEMFVYNTDSVTNITRVEGYNVAKIKEVYGEDFVIKHIVIPTKTPDGKAITKIANGANFGISLETVIIPEGITEIGNSAFAGNKITKLSLSDTVKTIGQGAFANNKIVDLIIGSSVETIGIRAFADNPHLRYVEIPDSVSSIGDNAFVDWTDPPVSVHKLVKSNLLIGDLVGPPIKLRGYTFQKGWTLQPLTTSKNVQSVNDDDFAEDIPTQDESIDSPELEVSPDDSPEENPEGEETSEDETVGRENDDELLDEDMEISDDKETEVDSKDENIDKEDVPNDTSEEKDKQ